MVKDAEANAEADKKRRAAVEAKNQAESLVHSAEKSLEDYGDKVNEADRGAIRAAIADLKAELEKRRCRRRDDQGQDRDARRSLDEARPGDVRGGPGRRRGGRGQGQSAEAKDDVVDADYEEVDDEQDRKKSA